jgi:hypothetical protein
MVTKNANPATGLVVIARAASGQIVTRITSHRDLVGAMHTARCVLTLKPDAVRVEVHHAEHSTSDYQGRLLTAMSRDDMLIEQIQ